MDSDLVAMVWMRELKEDHAGSLCWGALSEFGLSEIGELGESGGVVSSEKTDLKKFIGMLLVLGDDWGGFNIYL